MTMMSIFVSHSHQDNAFCQTLVKGLRTAGADVWYDEHNMGSGRLGPTIERELLARPVFVVILSPAALQSSWVEDETRWAYRLYRREPTRILLPVIAQSLPDVNALWLFLEDFKRVEAGEGQAYTQAEAVRHVVRALALTPPGERVAPLVPQIGEDVDALIERGRALNVQAKYADALTLFQQATVLAPTSSVAWGQLGHTLTEMTRYAEALVAFELALTFDSRNALAWSNKGTAFCYLHRYAEALVAYDQALILDSRNAFTWNGKGNALSNLHRYAEALVACEQALILDSRLVTAWNEKGNALSNLHRNAEALVAYEQALILDPRFIAAWTGKGNTLSNLQRSAEALVAYEQALILDPRFVVAWIGKGAVLHALGRPGEARAAEAQAKALQ